jgi:hypothetical protein
MVSANRFECRRHPQYSAMVCAQLDPSGPSPVEPALPLVSVAVSPLVELVLPVEPGSVPSLVALDPVAVAVPLEPVDPLVVDASTPHSEVVHAQCSVVSHVQVLHPSSAGAVAPTGEHACPLTAEPRIPPTLDVV